MKQTVKDFLTWEWTKKLLYWLIISAGTVSECYFLVASIWMSVNSSVHSLILSIMNERTAQGITGVATAGYVALPELILGLAFVTVIGHWRMWRYQQDKKALVWFILYGMPTVVFLVLSLVTLGCSVTSTSFIMPIGLVVVRALAGYTFAFTSLLYSQLGLPQEKDRLTEKDGLIAELKRQNTVNLETLKREKDVLIATLTTQKDGLIAEWKSKHDAIQEKWNAQNAEMEILKASLEQSINAERALHNAIHKSNDDALQAYSSECLEWLNSGAKTVNIDSITHFTGIQKRKIEKAIAQKQLSIHPRNKELILVSSLIPWLKTMQPSNDRTDEKPFLHVVNG